MAHQQNRLFPQSLLKAVLIFIILLKDVCNGQPQLIGPSQALVARAGDDVILPCHVEPAYDDSTMTLEWTRSSLHPEFVYVSRASQEIETLKNPSFKKRTSVFVDELKYGNISLKISKVKFNDTGTYRCYVPEMKKEAFVELVVASDAVTSPVVRLSGIDKNRGGVVLQCESAGWYPEPELLWLDGEGNLLSAGPTETLRGPDDLYTVSSRVTVEKRHSNNITCRVQQRNTNQNRESHTHVPEEYFKLTSSSAAPIIIGVVVSLVVIILILIVVFFIWRRNKTNVRKPHCLRKKQETTKTETDQEQETLMTQNIEPSGGSTTLTKHQQLMEQNMKEEESSKTEFEINQHAAEEKLKEEHHHLQKKHAEISNMKKEEENQEADKKFKKDDKKQDFQEAKQPDVTEVVNHQNTPELEIPRRTNTHTFVATTQTTGEERPGWRHPAGTEQKPQESAAMSSQAQPAADCTRADRPLSPDTQDPRAPHTPTDARPSSCQEQKQEADKKMKDDETQDFQQEVKQPSIKERMKQFEENQQSPPDDDTPRTTTTGKIKTPTQMRAKDSPGGGHPPDTEQKPHRSVAMSSQAQPTDSCPRADRPLGPETQDPRAPHTPTGVRQSQGVQAQPSSCQPETSKHKTQRKSQRNFQEQNKSSSANHSSARGDIILDKLDKLGTYICLKNTSSENKLMGDWEVKLQVNETQPVTYRVETNFTLKAGERLTLHRKGAMNPYPDDAEMMWMGMTDWDYRDDLKISLVSNTGEEHRLK